MLVRVVGAGVSGLSCAVRLLEAGHEVVVHARERSPGTTSDVAAAIHYPFLAEPLDRVARWTRRSMEAWRVLAHEPDAGVRILPVVQWFTTDAPDDPGFLELDGVERVGGAPEGFSHGLTATTAVIDMARYLPWLEGRVLARGGTIEPATLARLAEVPPCDVVVHCSGLGARWLVDDAAVVPVQGQVVRVVDPGLERAVLDQRPEHLTYVIPLGTRVVLGGTAVSGATDTTPVPAVEAVLRARAEHLEPRVAGQAVVSRAVGLRPGRDRIRLEAEVIDGRPVVHNYGHGGSGVTVSWGCAEEVTTLVAGLAAT